MAKPRLAVNIDAGTVLLVAAGLGVAYFIWSRDIVSKINPNDPNNIINQAAIGIVGEENLSSGFDYVFGAIDLLNPFAPDYRRDYAKQIYGWGNPL